MRKEIKELYIELLKNKKTIEDLRRANRSAYEFRTSYCDLGPIKVEVDFNITQPHDEVLSFLYPVALAQ